MIRRFVGAVIGWIRADRNLRYDQETVAVMSRVLRPSSTGVDVGAHAGEVLQHMVRLAPQGRHFAFEPIPSLCKELVRRFPDVDVHEVALADVAGSASYEWVVSNPGYSGLLRRRFDRPHEEVVQIDVATARLDDIVPAHVTVDFMKIDVEGAELQVLRGAGATLRRSRPVIVFEHGVGAADVYGTRPQQVFDVLTLELGLKVSLMASWLRGRPALSREEFIEAFESRSDYYFMAHPSVRAGGTG